MLKQKTRVLYDTEIRRPGLYGWCYYRWNSNALKAAKKSLIKSREKHPDHEFRLLRVTITREVIKG